jgi:hypothetical protein
LQEQNAHLKEFIQQNAKYLQKAKEGLVPSTHTGIIKVKINNED